MGRITPLQVFMFFSQFLYSTMIGFFISPLVRNAGYSVWISVIAGSALGLLIAFFAYKLSLRRPNRSLGQYGHEILGKWLHYPLILFVIFVNVFAGALMMRQLEDFIIQIYLPDTPEWAIAILFGICVTQAVRFGAGTMFRSAQGLFFFSVISVLLFPMFVTKELKLDMAVAFFTNFNPPGIWNSTLMIAGLFGELAFIVYLFPHLTRTDKTMKALGGAAILAAFITLTIIIPAIMLLGPELTANLTYPTLELIRYNRTGSFLENLDPLLIVFWLFSMFLKIGLFLLIAVTALTHTFGRKDHKPFTYALAAGMVCMSFYMFKSLAQVEEMTNRGETAIMLFLDLVPILYLLVDWLRSLFSKKSGDLV